MSNSGEPRDERFRWTDRGAQTPGTEPRVAQPLRILRVRAEWLGPVSVQRKLFPIQAAMQPLQMSSLPGGVVTIAGEPGD